MLTFYSNIVKKVLDTNKAKQVITKLEGLITSHKHQLTAKCVAAIITNLSDSALQSKYIQNYNSSLNKPNKMQAAMILGEIGRVKDLSSVANI